MAGSFIPFTDCCEASLEFTLVGIPGAITLGFHHTVAGAFGVADLGDLATVIDTALITNMKLHQCNMLTWHNIHLRDLDSISGAVFDQPLAITGAITTTCVPSQVAMTVTFLTGVAGRSYRGRNYIPALPVVELNNAQTWGPTIVGLMQGYYETFDVALAAVDAEHVVLSRFNGGAPRVSGVATPVIGYRANVPVFTQRRRLT